jgi:glycosyltransferase involved in cell wall biosynthesis
MNIAFLTSEYPHPKILKSAGIGTSVKNLAVALAKRNYNITVFVYGQDCDEVFVENGVEIHKIKYVKFQFLSWFFYRKKIQNYINRFILKNNISCIEAPDWTGVTAFMKFKCHLVIRLHGSDAYFCSLEGRKQKFKNYFFEKVALKSADSIISVSSFTAKKTTTLFNLSANIKIIHNGIDMHYFNTKLITGISKTTNKAVKTNQLLYFGTIIRKKGVLELAEIFNEVIKEEPTTTLTLLGKDVVDIFENKSTLQLFKNKLSKEAKLQLTHIGEVTYDEVKSYINKATVVVLPSFAEAFPMTWLEAMAMGKALVTSNIGWATELMIDGETGYMEHPKNHIEFANKIIVLLQNKELNSTFGLNAKKRIATHFSIEIIGDENSKYFQSIVHE